MSYKPVDKEKEQEKKPKFSWKDFVFGFMSGAVIFSVGTALLMKSVYNPLLDKLDAVNTLGSSNNTTIEEDESTVTATDAPVTYQTGIKDYTITGSDGVTTKYYTPSGWFSLTDQYMESLIGYYGKDLSDVNVICCGNNADQFSATITMNARPFSSMKETLQTIQEDKYTDDMLYGDAYLYMTTGDISDEAKDANVVIDEVGSYESDGHMWTVYHLGYVAVYTTGEDQYEEIPQNSLIAYSDTEDVIEVVAYMADYDQVTAVNAFREFIGLSTLDASEIPDWTVPVAPEYGDDISDSAESSEAEAEEVGSSEGEVNEGSEGNANTADNGAEESSAED